MYNKVGSLCCEPTLYAACQESHHVHLARIGVQECIILAKRKFFLFWEVLDEVLSTASAERNVKKCTAFHEKIFIQAENC